MRAIPDSCIAKMEPISLEEMGKVKLMNRVDSKYVTTPAKVIALLEQASEDYMVQEIDGERNMPYFTRYYDTAEAHMFYQHQRGKKARQKIRTRLYEGTMDFPFLEIKDKNNKGRTKKKRVGMEEEEKIEGYAEFISENSDYETEGLLPKIENHFYRITLVNKDLTERITIDSDIRFHNLETGKSISLPELCVIEWKRDGISVKSRLQRYLREFHIHESGFSKYCIGMALTDPCLKQNRLKPRLRLIEKIRKNHKRAGN